MWVLSTMYLWMKNEISLFRMCLCFRILLLRFFFIHKNDFFSVGSTILLIVSIASILMLSSFYQFSFNFLSLSIFIFVGWNVIIHSITLTIFFAVIIVVYDFCQTVAMHILFMVQNHLYSDFHSSSKWMAFLANGQHLWVSVWMYLCEWRLQLRI